MTRINAFLIHLGISLIIFLVLLYFIIYQWYPNYLFTADGGWQGIRIIAIVDLVLGPLLTLIVYKPGKPGLKLDLSLIATVQVIALTWGTWITYTERPYVTVFADYYFKPLTKYQYDASNPPGKTLTDLCPKQPCLIYSNLPADKDELNAIRKKALQTATPLHMLGKYYLPFSAESIHAIKDKNINLAELIINDVIDRKIPFKTQEKMVAYQKYSNRLMFLQINSRYSTNIAVFDPTSFQIVDTIDYDPRTYK